VRLTWQTVVVVAPLIVGLRTETRPCASSLGHGGLGHTCHDEAAFGKPAPLVGTCIR
jgi:hypothetical protein